MNRIEQLKKLIKDNKAFNKGLKKQIADNKAHNEQYEKEIKQEEIETEIIKTTHVPKGDYTTAQLKDLVILSENK